MLSQSDAYATRATATPGKVTVLLLQRHTAYWDVIGVLIRMRHDRAIPRTEIIRAFVEFMQQSAIDFSQFSSGDEMTAYLTEYFRAIPNRRVLPAVIETSLLEPCTS
jgi:hypothetical protein